MSGKKIPIPIARFEADRQLSCDVFIHLTLNRRFVRIANNGEGIGAPQLERIRSKGFTHLEVEWDESKGKDPDTYPLYLDGSSPSAAPGDSAIQPDAATSEAATLKATPAEQEGAELVKGDERAALELVKVSGSSEAEEGSILVKGAKDGEAEGSILVSPSSTPEEASETLAGAALEGEEAQRLKARAEAKEEESRFSPGSEVDPDGLVAADAETPTEPEERLQAGAEPDGNESRFGQSKTPSEVVYQVSSEAERESAIFRLEQKLESAKEQLLAGGTFGLAKEKANILKDAKSSILASKISDRIIELKKQPVSEDRKELENLKTSLKSAEAGDDLTPENEERFSVSKEMKAVEGIFSTQKSESEKVLELSEQLANFAKSREAAKSLLEEDPEQDDLDTARPTAQRDTPIAASKLAAYLGLALGYVNQRYLTDLSVSAIAHFARKEGKDLLADALPELAKRTSSDEGADSVVADSLEVIAFLDFYLSDPECDKTEKEFSKKIFEKITASAEQSRQFDPWHLKCWATFVERGPTMETHSLCTRASAQALKLYRSAVSE